jgi:acyl dehydratase
MPPVAVGDELPPFEIPSVSAAAMKTMAALLRDPNPIHFDVAAVQAAGLGDRVINQGPSNVGYVMNLLLAWVDAPEAVRSLKVRFTGNVLAGDHVRARGRVRELVADVDGTVLAVCDVWLERADDGHRLVVGDALVVPPAG